MGEVGGCWSKKLTFPYPNLVSIETSQIWRLGENTQPRHPLGAASCAAPGKQSCCDTLGDTFAWGQGTTEPIPILAMGHGLQRTGAVLPLLLLCC